MALQRATARPPSNPTGRSSSPVPDFERDRWGRPLIVPAAGGTAVPHTRASTLGGTLEDQYGLSQWRMRQVALGMGARRDLQVAAVALAHAETLDKRALGALAEQAMEAAESSAAATVGTALHALTELVDTGRPVPDVAEHAAALGAYRHVMSHFEVLAIEMSVVCDRWCSAGRFDRLVSPLSPMSAPDGTVFGPGDVLVCDLKTSSTANYFGIKFAVQLAVYAHGDPYDLAARARTVWPRTPDRRWALILHVPSGGSTADLLWVDLEYGAVLADLACAVREWRRRKDLILPAALPAVATPVVPAGAAVAPPAAVQLGGNGSGHVLADHEPSCPEDRGCAVCEWGADLCTVCNEAEGGLAAVCPGPSPASKAVVQVEVVAQLRATTSRAQIDALFDLHVSVWSDFLTAVAKNQLAELGESGGEPE